MSRFEEWKKREETVLCKTYGRYPVSVDHAKGSRMWDADGKEYLDLLSGIAVTSLGHCNEELAEVIAKQAQKLIHVSNLFFQEEQLDFADALLATCHMDNVFFCNSGAESNEAAIKLARRYQQKVLGKDAYEIITLEQAFHGRTLAALSATGQAKYMEGFAPRTEGFVQVPWHDIEAVKKAINQKTAAVLIEVVQGEGGINTLSKEYCLELQKICQEKDILFMVDEVQSGLCRTGKWWAYQHYDLKPDVITSAKALANGLPLGAMLCTAKASQAFEFGSHATTFGGGALVTKVGLKVLEIMKRDNLADNATKLGDYVRAKALALNSPWIKEARGLGLMVGIELSCSADSAKLVWDKFVEAGFILNLTQGTTLRLLPALNIEQNDLDKFINCLEALLKDIKE